MYLKTILILVHLCALSLGMHVQLGNSLSENSEDEFNNITTITTGMPELPHSSQTSDNSMAVPADFFRFDYKYYPQSGWFKLHEVPADWHTARLQCYAEGATLASPYDANILSIIRNIQYNQNLGSLHSGVHASFSHGVFTSVDGIPMNKLAMKWRINEPNYNQTKQCTAYFNNGMGVSNCDDILPYICFRNKNAEVNLNECGTVDKAYSLDANTKHCYKFHNRGKPWAHAMRICQAEGGYLAIINNAEEAEVLKKLFKSSKPVYVDKTTGFFVGFKRWDENFWTVHGQTLEEAGYANWMKGEPNGLKKATGEKENCATMLGSGELNDAYCDSSFAFVCEKTTDSLLTSTCVGESCEYDLPPYYPL